MSAARSSFTILFALMNLSFGDSSEGGMVVVWKVSGTTERKESNANDRI